MLWRQLRCQKKRKKRYGKTERRGISRIGDLEADTIIDKRHRSAIVSLVDRKSGCTWIKKVTRKTALQVGRVLIR